MNHPNYEQWLPYLEGAAAPEIAARLNEHLENCPECAAEIAGWRRSIRKLESLPWLQPQSARPRFTRPALKWGIAAALILSLGFAAGRLSTSGVAAQVEAKVRQEFKADLLAATAADDKAANDDFRRELRVSFQTALARNLEASTREQQRLAQDLLQVIGSGRDEDRHTFQLLLDRVQQKQGTDILALRADVETLATMADDRLQQTGRQLARLAIDTHTVNHP